MKTTIQHPALSLLLIAIILLGLILGKTLLIPLVLALLLWYLVDILKRQIAKVKIGKWSLPNWMQITVSTLLFFAFIRFVGRLVVLNLKELREVAPEYNERFLEYSAYFSNQLEIPSLDEFLKQMNLTEILELVLNSSISFLSATFIVLFYAGFMFIEQGVFLKKLKFALPDMEKRLKLFKTIKKIDESVNKYLSVKSTLSLIVGLITIIVLLSFGIDFAYLWAFLAFLLNFIPFVGAFVAIVFPTLVSLLQFGAPEITVSVFLILASVQIVIGNVIEPKMVGKSLNLSPLVVILALAFWGAIWGLAGMFLCVPITVTLMIVLNQFPRTKPVAIMLSAGHDIDSN